MHGHAKLYPEAGSQETCEAQSLRVPVVNRVGFELVDRGSKIDGKDISRLFPGNPKGACTDQVAYVYFEEVIKKADVMIDFHAGGTTAYERYVLFGAEKDPDNLTEMRRSGASWWSHLDWTRLRFSRQGPLAPTSPKRPSRMPAWCSSPSSLVGAPAGTQTVRTMCGMLSVASGTR